MPHNQKNSVWETCGINCEWRYEMIIQKTERRERKQDHKDAGMNE